MGHGAAAAQRGEEERLADALGVRDEWLRLLLTSWRSSCGAFNVCHD
jgi:hypothetical protein